MASKAKQIYWAVRRVLTEARHHGRALGDPDRRPGAADDHFETMVYYADGPVNLYQIRRWYEPLKALDRQSPVLIVCRSVTAHVELLEVSPTGRLRRTGRGSGESRGPAAVRNRAVRQPEHAQLPDDALNTMLHVFISHGERQVLHGVRSRPSATTIRSSPARLPQNDSGNT